MRKRNAFLQQYQQQEPFKDGLGEFDTAREVVMDLVTEYQDAEKETYLSGGADGEGMAREGAGAGAAAVTGGDGRTDGGVTGR